MSAPRCPIPWFRTPAQLGSEVVTSAGSHLDEHTAAARTWRQPLSFVASQAPICGMPSALARCTSRVRVACHAVRYIVRMAGAVRRATPRRRAEHASADARVARRATCRPRPATGNWGRPQRFLQSPCPLSVRIWTYPLSKQFTPRSTNAHWHSVCGMEQWLYGI